MKKRILVSGWWLGTVCAALCAHAPKAPTVSRVVQCYDSLKDVFLTQRSRCYFPTKKMTLTAVSVTPKESVCPFCLQMAETDDKKNLILGRTAHAIIALSFYPCFDGHMLIIPCRHVASLTELTLEERRDVMTLTVVATEVLATEFHAEGANVGINIGRVAGASIPDHLHVQVVPRWEKYRDTFLQIYGNVSLAMYTLQEVYALLAPAVAQKLSLLFAD